MRCPKCHYLSFEPEPRCRNCGFALALDESDLRLKSAEPADDTPLDLALRSTPDAGTPLRRDSTGRESMAREPMIREPIRETVPEPAEVAVSAAAEREAGPFVSRPSPAPRVDRPVPRPSPPARSRTAVQTPPAPTSELPLFVKGLPTDDEGAPAVEAGTTVSNVPVAGADSPPFEPALAESPDVPLVPMTAEPRRPLGVRRKAGEGGAPRVRHGGSSLSRKLGPLDRDLLEDLQRIERLEKHDPWPSAAAGPAMDRAGAAKRAAAAALDAALMGGLAAAVVGVTLRWCDIPWARANTLPALPLVAFVLLVGVGYLLMFTAAGGQTIGKMVVGLRVVGDPDRDVSVKQALYRSLLTVPSVLAFGAGFVPALLGDERALHDRLTHTRVVRA